MKKLKIKRSIDRLRDEEDAAALTEFTMFLPIWILVFVGIINLGQIGIFATKVQLQNQRDLWDQAIDVTATYTSSVDQMSPIAAAGFTGVEYADVANTPGNDQAGNDGIEAIAQVPLGLYGHFGESAEKSTIPLGPFVPSAYRTKYQPTEVLQQSDTNRYPHKIVNDTLADQDFSGSGVAGIVTSLIAASGLVQSAGAGIRYGSVFANKSETGNFIGGRGTFTAGAHYDVLVPPRAVTGAEAEVVPFGIAFIMFKADSKYQEFLMFGKENWGGGSGSVDTPEQGEWDDEVDAETEADTEQECNDRKAASSYDPDAENPGPKPSWWDDCGF